MKSNIYTEEYLDALVQDWYLEYAAAGIEVGDPLYEWDNAHHPTPKCKRGTKTIPLMRKHHAVHGVVQSEIFQYPCISCVSWERPYLPEEYLDIYGKWKTIQARIGGSANTPAQQEARERVGKKVVREGLGIHNPEYRESEKFKEAASRGGKKTLEEGLGFYNPEYQDSEEFKEALSRGGEKGGKKNGRKMVEEKLGIHNPELRESEEYKKMLSDNGKRAGEMNMGANMRGINNQKWVSLIDGFVGSPGNVARHNKSIGADPSARARIDG